MRSRWLPTALLLALVPLATAQAQESTRWSLERVARIGSENDTEQALTRIGGIVIGADNELFVAQAMDRTIRVFSTDGRLLRSIGRSGAGPGEFDLISGFGMIGDTVFVADNRHNRVTFFSRTGETLQTVDLTSPMLTDQEAGLPFYGPSVPRAFFTDGSALVVPGIPVMLMERGTITRIPYLRIDRAGRLLDTLAWAGVPARAVEVSHDGQRFYARRPFDDAPLMDAMADGSGLVIVERHVARERNSSTFRVTRLTPNGDTAFTRVIEYTPLPVSDAIVARRMDDIRETMRRRGEPPASGTIERALRAADAIPVTLPPVTSLATAQDGTIWLRREESTTAEQSWLIVSATGVPLATVTLPAGVEVGAARGDLLVTIETDALDVPYIGVHRIRRNRP